MNENEYEPCSACGGKIIDDTPSFISLSEDDILKITNQRCTSCNLRIIGKHQKLEIIHDREMVKKLNKFKKIWALKVLGRHAEED